MTTKGCFPVPMQTIENQRACVRARAHMCVCACVCMRARARRCVCCMLTLLSCHCPRKIQRRGRVTQPENQLLNGCLYSLCLGSYTRLFYCKIMYTEYISHSIFPHFHKDATLLAIIYTWYITQLLTQKRTHIG